MFTPKELALRAAKALDDRKRKPLPDSGNED